MIEATVIWAPSIFGNTISTMEMVIISREYHSPKNNLFKRVVATFQYPLTDDFLLLVCLVSWSSGRLPFHLNRNHYGYDINYTNNNFIGKLNT